jgi:hypothetical protein
MFALIKKGNKILLPCLLQRMESHLVLLKIAKRISRERPELPIFSIHDSLTTTVGNEDYVRRIMEEELLAAIGFSPTLKTEPWQPSILDCKN